MLHFDTTSTWAPGHLEEADVDTDRAVATIRSLCSCLGDMTAAWPTVLVAEDEKGPIQGSGAGSGGQVASGGNKRVDLKSSRRAFPTEQRGPVPGLGRLGEGRDEPESGWGSKESRVPLDTAH